MPTPRLQAALLGVAAGMRAAVAPALVAQHLRRRPPAPLGQLSALGSRRAARALTLAAVGELIGDKLPATPNRTDPGPLVGRALAGALCGAALCRAAGDRGAPGALVGAVSAVGGAWAFFHLRRALGGVGVPDLAAAVAEDGLLLALAGVALNAPREGGYAGRRG
jgi:uncharacterized membrane protein